MPVIFDNASENNVFFYRHQIPAVGFKISQPCRGCVTPGSYSFALYKKCLAYRIYFWEASVTYSLIWKHPLKKLI